MGGCNFYSTEHGMRGIGDLFFGLGGTGRRERAVWAPNLR